MAENQDNSDKALFREAMDALGVKAQTPAEKKNLTTTRKNLSVPKNTDNTSVESVWPVIDYKDLEPEVPLQASDLSAPLSAGSAYFHRGGLTQKHIKRLQRGQYKIASRLDLHGYTVDEAIQALNQHINHCHIDSQSCCLIIHGKGYHSQDGGPKLKSLTERWLKAHPRTIAYNSAQAKDGGTGALYVLLKK